MEIFGWVVLVVLSLGVSLVTISIGFSSAVLKCGGELLAGIVVSTALWFLVYSSSPFTIGLAQ